MIVFQFITFTITSLHHLARICGVKRIYNLLSNIDHIKSCIMKVPGYQDNVFRNLHIPKCICIEYNQVASSPPSTSNYELGVLGSISSQESVSMLTMGAYLLQDSQCIMPAYDDKPDLQARIS